jgi:septum formation protein
MVAITKSNPTPIVLASSSQRRIDMLKGNGYLPRIISPNIEENMPLGVTPQEGVMFLALKKALSVEKLCKDGEIIIAADTIVLLDEIIGKPISEDDAYRILSLLNGKTHCVITGVALLKANSFTRTVFYETTFVTFVEYSKKDIIDYIQTKEPYDKAGGYAIQGTFGKYVSHINGDRNNVIGLPWERVEYEINKIEAKI